MVQSKATKKFEKNNLKETLKRRKDFAKIKQRHQLKAKKKGKKAADAIDEDTEANGDLRRAQPQGGGSDQAAFEDMTVDDFFSGGFEIADSSKSGGKLSGKRKRSGDIRSEDPDSSVASVEEHAALESSSSGGDGQDEALETETHKRDLEALKLKDPEFHKFLQEEDPELLGFGEDSTLAEVDQLSDAEETAKTKKRKSEHGAAVEEPSSNDVSAQMVQRWTSAMRKRSSLRAMKEVVLAFRAAAHLNEEDGKDYKYTISNADGKRYRDLPNRTLANSSKCIMTYS